MNGDSAPANMAADAEQTAVTGGAALTEELKTNLDKVDLLIADLGQIGDFNRNAARFVKEAAVEIMWNGISRAISVVVSIVVMVVLLIFLYDALATNTFAAAFTASPNALPVLTGGTIGGVVVLAIGLTRAVHATFAERNAGMPMPEQLKAVVETVKSILPHQ